MIESNHLIKSFGRTRVLDRVSFTVPAGSITALVGPNGSGKTTTLHLLAGLAAPEAGSAKICGIDICENRPAALERLAFLPQDVRFHEALTPRQVLEFYADLRSAQSNSIEDILTAVDLTAAADRPCSTLSGGMRQRLGIGLLVQSEADVLLLDEPALSLDPRWREHLRSWLRERADAGATVLMATHLLEVWQPAVDRVLTCAGGKVNADDPVSVGNREQNVLL